jgi:5-methyltetrahydrofolate--homocysteine methyltransferase
VGPTALVAPGDPRPPSQAELRGWYEGPLRALAAAGADLLWAESHWDLSEALAALSAARATGLPVAVTLTPSAAGERLSLPGGNDADEALLALAGAGAAAVGVNCLLPGAPIAALAARLSPRLAVPLVVKPSAGLPGALLAPEAFAAWVGGAARAGAGWVGGCCGTGAAHLGALARALAAQEARG